MTDAGAQTWAAVGSSAVARRGGTSGSDIKAYATAGGSAAAAAACAGAGPGAAIACGAVGGMVAGAIVDLGSALFGSSSPGLNDIYNPIADRIIARLVLASQGKPNDDAAIHALGESGIRRMAGRQANGEATDPGWIDIASRWSIAANAFAQSHNANAIQWWYPEGPKAGRIRQAAIQQWIGGAVTGKGLEQSAQIPQGMVAATADTGAALARGSSSGGGSSGGGAVGTLAVLGIGGWALWYAFRRKWIRWPT